MKKNLPSWGVVRSSHNTASRSFSSALPYVMSSDGMRRIVGDVDAPATAVEALRRHASVTRAAREPYGGRRAA